MWYIIFLQSYILWLPAVILNIDLYKVENTLNEFLLLGIIPGTNMVISFEWIIALFWIGFFYWLFTKLSTNQFEKHRATRRSMRINQISL